MSLADIPTWGYLIAIAIMELLATLWYLSSVRRGREEGVSIRFEKVTYISAVVFGVVGAAVLLVIPAVVL